MVDGFDKYGMPQGFGQPTINKDIPPNNPARVDHMDDNPMQPQRRTPPALSQAVMPRMGKEPGGGFVGPAAHLPSIPMGMSTQDLLKQAANPEGYFESLTKNLAPTPDDLQALAPQLAQHGIKVLTNARGIAGKIQEPSGRIVDVLHAAGNGGDAWQYYTGGGGPPSGGLMGLPSLAMLAIGGTPHWQDTLNTIQQQQQQATPNNPLLMALRGY